MAPTTKKSTTTPARTMGSPTKLEMSDSSGSSTDWWYNIKCDECEEVIADFLEYDEHKKEVHRGEFHCYECRRVFASDELRTKHRNAPKKMNIYGKLSCKIDEEKAPECEKCHLEFSLVSDWFDHFIECQSGGAKKISQLKSTKAKRRTRKSVKITEE